MSLCIFGWAPPNNAEYVDVLLPVHTPTCHSPTSPGSCTASTGLTSGISPELKRDQQVDLLLPTAMGDNKDADSPLVARPRNKFILFRCDYVRKHSRDGKHLQPGIGNLKTEESLSKQAAEAWRHLSGKERLYWKKRATEESIEHARRYPGYRYRPKKSASGKTRQARFSTNNSEATLSSSIAQLARPDPQSLSGSPASSYLTRPTPRRSSSVPHFAVANSLDESPGPPDIQDWSSTPRTSPSINMTRDAIGSPCNQYTMPFKSPLRLQIPVSSSSFNSPEMLSPVSFLTNSSPSTSSTTSSSPLSNWNGENTTYPCRSGSMSDVSTSGLSLSNLDLGLEMGIPADRTSDGTNQSFIHVGYTTESGMPFEPPPSFHRRQRHHQQQQQLFDDGLYQPTGNFWIESYPVGSMSGIQRTVPAASPANFHTAYAAAHAQNVDHAPSTSPLQNGFYESMTSTGRRGP